MTKYQITAPDGQKFVVTAPEGATAEQAYAAFQKSRGGAPAPQAAPAPAPAEAPLQVPEAVAPQVDSGPLLVPTQAMSGVNEGLANFLSLPNTIVGAADMGLRSIGPAIGNALGGDFAMPTAPLLKLPDAGENYRNIANEFNAIRPETEDVGGQMARRVGEEVGSTIVPWAKAPAKVAGAVSTILSGGGAALAQQLFPDNQAAEFVAQLLFGGGSLGVTNAVEKQVMKRAGMPTVESLSDEATTLYKAANAKGAQLPQADSAKMSKEMRDIASAEGIITPSGRINESYEKIGPLIRSFDDYGQGALSVDQMQSVRRLITNALKSKDGDERRIAMQMLDRFHKYLDPIAPEIAQANQIYHRAMNGEMLETAVEVAQQKAGQYGRSFDATLRETFGDLERQIIKGKLKGFSAEEIEAIKKVAQGGPVENLLRQIGKAAPTGVVSMAASSGIPFAIGNAFGGPLVGTGASLATMGGGFLARAGANKMTSSTAQQAIAESLLAGAPQVNVPAITPNTAGAAGALVTGQAANQNTASDEVARLLAGN